MLVEVFIQNSLVLKLSYYHILYKKIITKTLKQLLQNIHFTKPIKKCLISLKQSSPLSLSHLWNCKKKKLYVTRPYYFFTYSGILILRVCVCGGGGPIFVAFVGNPCLIQSDTVKTECFHKFAQFLCIGAVVHIITLLLHFNYFFPSSMFRRVSFKKKTNFV